MSLPVKKKKNPTTSCKLQTNFPAENKQWQVRLRKKQTEKKRVHYAYMCLTMLLLGGLDE